MTLEWKTSKNIIEYPEAINFMEKRIAKIALSKKSELIWLLEHPPIFTAGTSANDKDLLDNLGLQVFTSGRGGQYTYHGPGQRIIYIMLDLKKRNIDIRLYVELLENWIISCLRELGIEAFRRKGRIGIWTLNSNHQEAKIAAIGIRVRKWITYHGISININPNLEHYRGIIPCGINDYGVTSLKELHKDISYYQLDNILKRKFHDFF